MRANIPAPFAHESLDVYQLAVEVARWFARMPCPRGDADLKDQGRRASRSICLNIAEGRSVQGKARLNHYRIARGSAAECCAVLDLVPESKSTRETQAKLRRVGMMLQRLG